MNAVKVMRVQGGGAQGVGKGVMIASGSIRAPAVTGGDEGWK